MDAFDKVEELLLAEGYSKEEIPAIMVSLVEQGMSPAEIISRGMVGLANMGLSGLEGADRLLKRLPQKRKPEPLPKTKAVADLLPDTQQPKAPKPEFGNNAAKPQPRAPRPELRPGGRTPEPQFRTTQPRTNAGGAVNIPRTNATTRAVQPQAPVPNFRTNTASPVASTATKGKGLFARLAPRIAPVAKQAYGAYRGTERMSKGDYLGAALGYGTAIPGLPGNVAMVADLLRGDPEVNNPDAFKPIPKRPGESDAGTSTATSGLPGFPKSTPQPDAYQSRPTSTKSDFERRQAEVLRAQQRSVSATQQQVNKDNQRYGNTVPAGSFGISQQGRAQAAANRAAVQPKVAPTPPAPTPAPPAPPVPKLTTAQQAVNTEYDKLRKSDPAAAVRYGLRMARAGASKSSFKLPK